MWEASAPSHWLPWTLDPQLFYYGSLRLFFYDLGTEGFLLPLVKVSQIWTVAAFVSAGLATLPQNSWGSSETMKSEVSLLCERQGGCLCCWRAAFVPVLEICLWVAQDGRVLHPWIHSHMYVVLFCAGDWTQDLLYSLYLWLLPSAPWHVV